MDAIKLFVMNNALLSQAITGIGTNKVVFTARCYALRKCSNTTVCRLSVRPSVALVNCDHTGWNSSKI